MAENKILRTILRDAEDCEFDLAGYTEAQAETMIAETFGKPLEVPPIRVSFIVGGGKAVRARYPAALGVTMGKALRAVGFEENSGAAAGDVGVFKHQHDTGANLMRLHVFCGKKPAAAAASGGGGAGEAEDAEGGDGGSGGVINRNGVVFFAAVCDLNPPKLGGKVVSWTQKKRMKEILEQLLGLLRGAEEKMTQMKPLTDEEREWYEVLNTELLEAKIKWLSAEMKVMVTEGKLTAPEKAEVLKQASERVAEAEKEVAKAKESGSASAAKLAAMQTALETMKSRVETITKTPPIDGHPVKNAAEIKKLAAKRALYLAMKGTGNRMLSLAEAKELAALEEANEQLFKLEEAARGWFEKEDEFQARLAPLLKAGAKGVNARK